MKISVDEKGVIKVDTKVVNVKEINSDFLRNIFLKSLKENVDYDLKEGHPIASLFKGIEEETAKGSVFNQKWVNEKNKYEKNIKDIEVLENGITKISDEK